MSKGKVFVSCFYFFSVVILVFPITASCQNKITSEAAYDFFDAAVGQTNTGMFKGFAYSNTYRTINEKQQFFNLDGFVLGALRYDKQPYFKVLLQYDVYKDELLAKNTSLASEPITILLTAKVDSFRMGKHRFARIQDNIVNKADGFFELLLRKGNTSLYKKHLKKPYKKTDETILYYEFKDAYYYVLFYQGTYHRFTSLRQLMPIFASQKNSLKQASKEYKEMKKNNSDAYVIAVINALDLFEVPENNNL